MNFFNKITDAQKVLENVANKTPILKVNLENTDFELYLKLENMQHTGSFKLRGAYYKINNLTQEEKAKGIIAASAGNHAQGVAFAANKMNIKATIVMPLAAPLAKVDATKKYGANVVLYGNSFDEAYQHARMLQKQSQSVFIEPFNDEDVMAGQGTIGLEIVEQLPDVDVVLVAIGGGGLAAGVSCAIKNKTNNCRVIGVEVENIDSMKKSLEQKEIVAVDKAMTVADGIAVKVCGDKTFEACQEYLDQVITVSEDEIINAMLTLIEKAKCITEGAGATAVAAALSSKLELKNKKVVAIVSGGNIDVTLLSRIIDRGLVNSKRLVNIGITLVDKPGKLQHLIKVISDVNVNIVSINHNRSTQNVKAGQAYVEFVLETTNQEHIKKLISNLEKNNYVVDRLF